MPKKKKGKHTDKKALRFFDEINIDFLIHELKDPVAAIETILNTLVNETDIYGPLNPRQEVALKRALKSNKKMQEMIYNLLEIGRGEAESFTFQKFLVVDVVWETLFTTLEIWDFPIFEKLYSLENREDQLSYLTTCGIYYLPASGFEDLEVIIDEIKFRQILTNLIKNALYHRFERLDLTLRKEEECLIVSVCDDGEGIMPEHHQLVFKPYIQIGGMPQNSHRGHGLGLAGARILARCMGGDIEIQSEKGKGALFQLSLPIIAAAA